MTTNITAIKGFNDILPGDSLVFKRIEDESEKIFTSYGFSEIRIPIAEKTELFLKSIGETTDIVGKQMYSFADRHGESVTLRPEGTASIVRAYIEHKLYNNPVTKVFYKGAMFRYERPQKGRYRQFYQIGVEALGEINPSQDAESLEMLSLLFSSLGVKGVMFEVNSLGCHKCRPAYKTELKGHLEAKKSKLCENCVTRLDKNPLRALDCKTPACIEATLEAPSILGFICSECRTHFEGLTTILKARSLVFNVNPRMVRGLDYYTKTTFEVTAPGPLGAQNAIAAGGRYDDLVKVLGGPPTPCFGFAIGLERLSLLMDRDAVKENPLICLILLGDEAQGAGLDVAAKLRKFGQRVVVDYKKGTLKDYMKRCDKMAAKFVIIIGTDELKKGVVTIKDMTKGTQEGVRPDMLMERFKEEGL